MNQSNINLSEMNTQKSILFIILFTSFILSSYSCTTNSTSVDDEKNQPEVNSTITFTNSGAQAYLVTNIEGQGASAEVESANPELSLVEGNRYTFINSAGASSHPLDFRDDGGDKLLGQSNDSGSLDSDDEVNVVYSGDAITFTLTDDIADELTDYICAFHPGMNGSIVISN